QLINGVPAPLHPGSAPARRARLLFPAPCSGGFPPAASRAEAGYREQRRRRQPGRAEKHRPTAAADGPGRAWLTWPAAPAVGRRGGRAGGGGMGESGAGPGTVRPGGRTARVRAAVLQAAGDLLAERGFDGLDLAEVARRAEVGRTTVYRRWGNPSALAADLLSDMADQSLPRTETGSLDGDLLANARLV